MTLPLTMLDSYTCEDSAVTRDRLNVLKIPYQSRTKENDESVIALLGKYNQGESRTPTLIFGADEIVLTEPTVEQLEQALIKAGYTIESPRFKHFDTPSVLPNMSKLPVVRPAGGGLRRAKQSILFFAHAAACRVCQGYARQIAQQRAKLAEMGVRLQIVLRTDVDGAKEWAREFAPEIETMVDVEGNLKRETADCFPDTWDIRLGGVWLFVVDQDEEIRAGVYASDAGGLVAPGEIVKFFAEPSV